MDTLYYYLTKLQASLLTIPFAAALVAVVAARLLLDAGPLPIDAPLSPWLYAGGAAAARDLLGALLSGMISMLSLVLSVTMVVVTLAAQQIGSRLIRSFIDDRVTQAVIGLFLGVLLYLLVVLAAVDEQPADQLPRLAITVAIVLAGLCMPALLFYVDKLARSIVFDHAANRMSIELKRTLTHMQSDQAGRHAGDMVEQQADAEQALRHAPATGDGLTIGRDGYVQSIAYDRLVREATRADVQIRLDLRSGHWVNADSRCIIVSPAASPALVAAIRHAVIIGTDRTPTQDIEYGLQRLVEMALRALSPGINDVFTALAAIDNIGASVAMVFSRPLPAPVLRDEHGTVRIVRAISDPAGILEAAFDQVRQSGATMPAVAIRLLDALGRLAPSMSSEDQRAAVLDQLDAVLASARRETMIPKDADAVLTRYRRARAALESVRPRPPAAVGRPARSEERC